jgi:hypothetical protein
MFYDVSVENKDLGTFGCDGLSELSLNLTTSSRFAKSRNDEPTCDLFFTGTFSNADQLVFLEWGPFEVDLWSRVVVKPSLKGNGAEPTRRIVQKLP